MAVDAHPVPYGKEGSCALLHEEAGWSYFGSLLKKNESIVTSTLAIAQEGNMSRCIIKKKNIYFLILHSVSKAYFFN